MEDQVRPARAARGALLGAVTVDGLGSGLFMPISLLYFTRVTPLSLTTVGALMSAAALLGLPVPVLTGFLVDRWSARDVVLAAQSLQALALALYLVARGPAAIFVALGLSAIGQRVFWSSLFSLVAQVPLARPGRRVLDRSFAILGMMQSAGYGGGALLAAPVLAVATVSAYNLLVALDAASFLLSAAALLTVPRTSPADSGAGGKEGGGLRRFWADRPYQWFIVVNIGFALCNMSLGVILPVFIIKATSAPRWVVGPALAVAIVLTTVAQPFALHPLRRLSRSRSLTLAGALWSLWALACAAALWVPRGWLPAYLIGTVFLYAGAEVVHNPVSNALSAESAPAAFRGTYLASFQYAWTVAGIVLPIMFTTLFRAGHAVPWFALAAIAALSGASMSLVGRRLPAAAVHGAALPQQAP